MPLTVGQRLTLLKIDDAMAMTHRYELDVKSVLDPHPVGYQGRLQRVAVVRQRGKRKDFFLDVAADDIVLDGWALPFKTDTEGCGVFSGNACFNLVGEPEVIRECIEGRAVLPVSESAKAAARTHLRTQPARLTGALSCGGLYRTHLSRRMI
jgi:hypothetical protein